MKYIKTSLEISILRECGRRLAETLYQVAEMTRPGVTGRQLDQIAEQMIRARGDEPAFLNYQPKKSAVPFPATLCVSINDEIVHGIPTDRVIKEGDVVGLDLGVRHRGLYTDMAVTVGVGKVSPQSAKLIEVTRRALDVGIASARPGNTVGDIGYAIEKFVKPHGYGIVFELGGHGVGRAVHEKPWIPNFGKAGQGEKLEAGMVIAIEPMLTLGHPKIKLGEDRFTCLVADGTWGAHFEHTVALTKRGPEILTKI